MSSAGERIDTDLIWQRYILAAFIGYDQGTSPLPELGAGIDVHDLGTGVGSQAAGQDAVGLCANRIEARWIGKWELVARIQMVFVLPVKSPGLGKGMVEENPPGPGEAGVYAVKDPAAGRRLVEAEAQEFAEKAARLRSPVDNDVVDSGSASRPD